MSNYKGEKNVIYGYICPNDIRFDGLIKVGETERTVDERKNDAVNTPFEMFDTVFEGTRIIKGREEPLTDHEIHAMLDEMGYKREKRKKNGKTTEWFRIDVETLKHAYDLCYNNLKYIPNRKDIWEMRTEQKEAVKKTSEYFKNKLGKEFLWNAKPRFGKCYTSYKLAVEMGWSKILVVTFKPAVEDEWKKSLLEHRDFQGWDQFIGKGQDIKDFNKDEPYVCFRSLQDLLGIDEHGNIKSKNTWIHDNMEWDCIIIDECHYGAHREKTKDLLNNIEDEKNVQDKNFGYDDKEEIMENDSEDNKDRIFNEISENLKNNIKSEFILHLSGTPYKILARGTFTEEQVFNWTYIEEQKLKTEGLNLEMPRINLLVYKLPEEIINDFKNDDNNSFEFKKWFAVNRDGKFENEGNIYDFLNLISRSPKSSDGQSGINWIKQRNKENNPDLYYLFNEAENKIILKHTLWYMPGRKECLALAKLLQTHDIFKKYEIIIATGDEIDCGKRGADDVKKQIQDANRIGKKTITLSCGMLTTGVTIPEWDAVLMLRNIRSPELFFQTAFRAQSPRYKDICKKEIDKKECYIIDFAPERALQMYEYLYNKSYQECSRDKHISETLTEYINYLPILIYDKAKLENISVEDVLEKFDASELTKNKCINKEEISYIFNNDNEVLRILNLFKIHESIDGKDKDVVNSNEMKKAKYVGEDNKGGGKGKGKNDIDKKFIANQEVAIKKLKTLFLEIPRFMYLSNTKISSLNELLNCQEKDLFKLIFKITNEELKYLFEKKCFNNIETSIKINQWYNYFKNVKIYQN